jgi:hypothetical protein
MIMVASVLIEFLELTDPDNSLPETALHSAER